MQKLSICNDLPDKKLFDFVEMDIVFNFVALLAFTEPIVARKIFALGMSWTDGSSMHFSCLSSFHVDYKDEISLRITVALSDAEFIHCY